MAEGCELFLLAVSPSGRSGLLCRLEPVRVGMNTELVPVRLGKIHAVVLRGFFNIGKR